MRFLLSIVVAVLVHEFSLSRLQKEKTSKMGELQQKALSRVEEKVNVSRMNIKEFRKGQMPGRIRLC